MGNKNKLEEGHISKAQYEDNSPNIVNDNINVISEDIPYQVVSTEEEIAVSYGPDPMFNEMVLSNEESGIIISIDSNMYGGPLPEDFYQENLELTALTNVVEFRVEESIESDNNKDNKKESDQNYLDCDDFIC